MRPILHFLPLILIPLALPAFAEPPAAPTPGPTHRIQVIRTGKGQARILNTSTSKHTLVAVDPAAGTGSTCPYQAAKPGEGAPKT